MEFIAYGVDFKNKNGEFCTKIKTRFYFFSYFRNDYRVEVDGKLVSGKGGDMIINKPGDTVYHGAATDNGEGFRNDWLYANGNEFAEILEKYPLPIGVPFHIDGLYLATAIEKIHKEKSYNRIGADDKCELILTNALIDIYREYLNGQASSADKLEYTRGEMLRDYKREWNITDLAKLSGYSQSRFCALYKEKYGTSPINDLISCRIENAKLLLRYGSMQVSEVAFAVGFSSIYYFSKCFKAREGISPSEYKYFN